MVGMSSLVEQCGEEGENARGTVTLTNAYATPEVAQFSFDGNTCSASEIASDWGQIGQMRQWQHSNQYCVHSIPTPK